MRINPDQMQERRFESKYVISEAVAEKVRAYARSYLVADRHSLGRPDSSYPVHSLYLDSDDLNSYWATVRRNDGRFKLRIRFYDDHASTPAFVEIKQRANDRTLKQRCPVPRKKLPAILTNHSAGTAWKEDYDPAHLAALENFIARMRALQAGPKLHVAYRREAYVSSFDNSVRLTLDREIRSEPASGFYVSTRMRRPRLLDGGIVILEIKITGPEPDWFREMSRDLNLRRDSFAKYVAAVAQHGLHVTAGEQVACIQGDAEINSVLNVSG